MKEKHPEEYKKAVENQQKQQQAQAQKALHGAKLNYFRTLKNQCAEDEEVVYYKKGGSVTCGCKKKEQGGEIPSAEPFRPHCRSPLRTRRQGFVRAGLYPSSRIHAFV